MTGGWPGLQVHAAAVANAVLLGLDQGGCEFRGRIALGVHGGHGVRHPAIEARVVVVLEEDVGSHGEVSPQVEGPGGPQEFIAVVQVELVCRLDPHVHQIVLGLGQVGLAVIHVVIPELQSPPGHPQPGVDSLDRVGALDVSFALVIELDPVAQRVVGAPIGAHQDLVGAFSQPPSGDDGGAQGHGGAGFDLGETTVQLLGVPGHDVNDAGKGIRPVDS